MQLGDLPPEWSPNYPNRLLGAAERPPKDHVAEFSFIWAANHPVSFILVLQGKPNMSNLSPGFKCLYLNISYSPDFILSDDRFGTDIIQEYNQWLQI